MAENQFGTPSEFEILKQLDEGIVDPTSNMGKNPIQEIPKLIVLNKRQ